MVSRPMCRSRKDFGRLRHHLEDAVTAASAARLRVVRGRALIRCFGATSREARDRGTPDQLGWATSGNSLRRR